MSMFLFLIIVVSLACGSVEPSHVPLLPCLGGSAGVLALGALVARAAAELALVRVRSGCQPLLIAERLQRQLELLRWLGIAAVLVCLLGFGLAAAVQTWPVFSQRMFLQAVVLLAPALVMIAGTLAAEHRYQVATGCAVAGRLPAAGQIAAALVRLAGWLVAPILVMLAVSDLLMLLPGADRISAGVGLGVLTLLIIPILVPWMATRVWATRPLDAAEHRWIPELVASAGVGRLNLRLWNTGMRSSNAVVVGFLPGLRSLLLSDRLVRDLPAEQLKLIVLHELAHIRRSHIWLRILSVLPGWLLAAAILHVWGTSPLWLLLSNLAAVTLTLVMLRLAAHATEFDADRAACELAVRLAGPAAGSQHEALAAALPARVLEPLATRHDCPQDDTQAAARTDAQAAAAGLADALRWGSCSADTREWASWLHPSVAARCRRLQRWADSVGQTAAVEDRRQGNTPCSTAPIQSILLPSAAASPGTETSILEKIDESDRCDYVQG